MTTSLKEMLSPGYGPCSGVGDGAQLVDCEWWRPAFGCGSLQKVVDNARAAPAAENATEALAARPLLEKVARLGDVIGNQTVAQVQQLAEQASAWLQANPPGQPVAMEPRGCPMPGVCSCVEPTPPAPEPGEAGELVAWMRSMVTIAPAAQTGWAKRFLRVATLLQQFSAPAPVPAPVAPSAEHDLSKEAPLLWLLRNHLGSQSPVGRVIREYLGMGRFERMTEEQIEAADHWAQENWRRLRRQPPAPQPEDPQP